MQLVIVQCNDAKGRVVTLNGPVRTNLKNTLFYRASAPNFTHLLLIDWKRNVTVFDLKISASSKWPGS